MTLEEVKSITAGQILYDSIGYYILQEVSPLPENYEVKDYFITEDNKHNYSYRGYFAHLNLQVGDRYRYDLLVTKICSNTFRPIKKRKTISVNFHHIYLANVENFKLQKIELEEKLKIVNFLISQFNDC